MPQFKSYTVLRFTDFKIQVRFIDRVVDIAVVPLRAVDAPKSSQTVYETVSAPQAQVIDETMAIPVVQQKNKFLTLQTPQKTVSDHAETGADHPENPEDC